MQVLTALQKVRPDLLTTENLVLCFLESHVTGNALNEAMKTFGLPRGLAEVLELCAQVSQSGFNPTFADVHDASRDKEKALSLCQRFVKSACNREHKVGIRLQGEDWFRRSFRASETRPMRTTRPSQTSGGAMCWPGAGDCARPPSRHCWRTGTCCACCWSTCWRLPWRSRRRPSRRCTAARPSTWWPT